MSIEEINYCIKSGMLGLVVADALGVPYEFENRSFCDKHPLTDMIGYGTYGQPEGTWSDDSSLALAGMDGLSNTDLSNSIINEDNLIENFPDIIEYEDIMDKFNDWRLNGNYSPHGEVFDIGIGTRQALQNSVDGCSALLCGGTHEGSNGNGSLMRILPISFLIYYLSLKYEISEDDQMQAVHNFSSLTHRHFRSQMGCGIYIKIALELIKHHQDKENEDVPLLDLVNKGIISAKDYYLSNDDFKDELENYERVFSLDIQNLPRDDINSGGYVISCLEAALWCLLNNDNYRDTALAAVNLGRDTDTTAAVAGGLAGLYYGYDGIPDDWLEKIANFEFVEGLINNFTGSISGNID